MNDNQAYKLENAYPVRAIQSEQNGLKYLVDDDRLGVIVSGREGLTGLTISQAKAVCRELPGILEGMGYTL